MPSHHLNDKFQTTYPIMGDSSAHILSELIELIVFLFFYFYQMYIYYHLQLYVLKVENKDSELSCFYFQSPYSHFISVWPLLSNVIFIASFCSIWWNRYITLARLSIRNEVIHILSIYELCMFLVFVNFYNW